MDGTLYQTANDVIQPSSIDAIHEMEGKGMQVFAATGRPLNFMKPILERVQFDGYVLLNGGYVLNGSFELIDSNPIKTETLDDLVKLSKEKQVGLMIHFGDETYIYTNFYPIFEFAKYTNSLDRLYYDPTLSYHKRHPAFSCTAVTNDPHIMQEFVEAHPDLRIDLVNVKTNGFAYDIFPADTDKSRGIQAVLDRQNLDWDQAVTIGDSTNDLHMLEKAGLGIAMGTAIDQVKDKADYVTTTVFDDGIANALEQIYKS